MKHAGLIFVCMVLTLQSCGESITISTPGRVLSYEQLISGNGFDEPGHARPRAEPKPRLLVELQSNAQGIAAGNIGLTQDFSARGLPLTVGVGLFAGAGAGVDFRHVPQSNGTHANIVALDTYVSAGVDLTERLSFGGSSKKMHLCTSLSHFLWLQEMMSFHLTFLLS